MQSSIFSFIFRYSKRQQFFILCITVLSLPPLYYSLDLPKQIINEAIGGQDFPQYILGIELDQIQFLLVLSFVFLALVFINGGFKYYINVYKGRLGERMLRRLRYELYTRVLLFRLPRFKRMSQGEIIPMITAEVEPLGGFIGDAFALPAYQGGLLLTYIAFIFVQDPLLGAAAVSLYPIQGYIIPRLQKKVNALAKRRVRNIRQLSDKVGETVSGTPEIHAHDTSQYHLADISERLAINYDIRYEIYKRKFFIKFLNNFLNQLTPFFFYSIGGYLVIQGNLTFGALVAVLAAYKDLASPWKELLTYYQMQADVSIKYDQVVEQFQPSDIQPPEQLSDEPTLEGALPAEWHFGNVAYAEEDSPPDIQGLSLTIPTKGKIAVLGDGSSGREVFIQLLGRVLVPSGGKITLGDHNYADLPESVTGRRITYVGPHSYIFTGSLRANLYYGLKHREVAPSDRSERRGRIAEAKLTGNSALDIHGHWIDYQAAAVDDADALERRALQVLDDVSLAGDVYRFGLSGTLNTGREPETPERILEARRQVGLRLADPEMEDLVELWDADKYNLSATLAENLLFGTPVDDTFQLETIAENDYVLSILDRVGLTKTFLDTGRKIAATMLELFADLPPGHEFFDQFSFISHDELPEFQTLVTRAEKQGYDALKPDDRVKLMSLPFKMIPTRHRLGVIDDDMKDKLLEARRLFAAELPESLSNSVAFFDAKEYNEAASLQDNILFGKIRYGQSSAQGKVQALLSEIIDGLDLRRTVIGVGLDRSVGVAGGRLSLVQRQKLALARALMKRPDVLVLLDATTAFDGGTLQRVHDAVIRACEGRGLIWAPHRPSMAEGFDEVIVLKDGRLAERGTFAELAGREGELRRLLDNE